MEHIFEASRIWCKTLAPTSPYSAQFGPHVERLRQAFLSFRERAATLAAEIAAALPDFTVHDVAHPDALWRLADLLCGPDYAFNPCEAFVLGGAFLLHDLGMALAAYPDGVEGLQRTEAWSDTIAAMVASELGREPTPKEVASPSTDIRWRATCIQLRSLHAARAETLLSEVWTDREGKLSFHLLEDVDLRLTFGSAIGKVARSHWLSVADIRDQLTNRIGAPVGFPDEWSVDLLKTACVLRTADYCHIDAGRAPAFLRTLRTVPSPASDHWTFQRKLLQPMRSDDRIVYSANSPFLLHEAAAWWLCYETLVAIDVELKAVDATLADTARERFAVRSVAYANDLDQLIRYIPTAGWTPVDARLHVSNLPALVRKLGGDQLYGDSLVAPIRELIQNGRDAVVARRILEGRAGDWGQVSAKIHGNGKEYILEIADTGVGMSSNVLTKILLDFGRSLWDAESVAEEFPGLLSKGFNHIGRYGIGFFSVFMLGDRVKVVSRRYDEAPGATRVLEFSGGLFGRPILRPAERGEILRDGGTVVSVALKPEFIDKDGLLKPPLHRDRRYMTDQRAPRWNIGQLCSWICPSIDVTLDMIASDGTETRLIAANDWLKIGGPELLRRIGGPLRRGSKATASTLKNHGGLVRPITDGAGRIVGRACIFIGDDRRDDGVDKGTVVVGGLRSCSLRHIAGLFAGVPIRASRDIALPLISADQLASWATEQAGLLSSASHLKPRQLIEAAQLVRMCGGDTGALPVVFTSSGFLSRAELEAFCDGLSEILVLSWWDYEEAKQRAPVELDPNVVVVSIELSTLLYREEFDLRWPDDMLATTEFDSFYERTLMGCVVEAAAERWKVPPLDVWLGCDFPAVDEDSWIIRRVGSIGAQPFVTSLGARILKPGPVAPEPGR